MKTDTFIRLIILTGMLFLLQLPLRGHAMNSDHITTSGPEIFDMVSLSAPDAENEIVVRKSDAKLLKGERVPVEGNTFVLDSVEIEIFRNTDVGTDIDTKVKSVTIAELVNALHFLEMTPERIIQFLQSAANSGIINARIFVR